MEQDQIVTAPRGMAFTIMSPTSRSSFMIEVLSAMVDMFEQDNYQSHYFKGEQGEEYWEDYIGNSRDEYEKNIEIRDQSDDNDEDDISGSRSSFMFTEISAEEADSITKKHKEKLQEDAIKTTPKKQPLLLEEDEDEPFSFTEITDSGSVEVRPQHVPDMPQPAPVQQPIDFEKLIATIRSEVQREMQLQLAANAVLSPTPAAPVVSEQLSEQSISKEYDRSASQPETEDSYSEYEADTDEDITDEDITDEDDADEDITEEDDFIPSFDIMSLLDQQLESYSEMGLEERMEEIEVDTMEISFNELASFIKDQRKKRGA